VEVVAVLWQETHTAHPACAALVVRSQIQFLASASAISSRAGSHPIQHPHALHKCLPTSFSSNREIVIIVSLSSCPEPHVWTISMRLIPTVLWLLSGKHSLETLGERQHNQSDHVLNQLDNPACRRPEFAFRIINLTSTAHKSGGGC
jgi:hypothetical protein